MTTADIIILLIIAAIFGGIVAYKIKSRKQSPCSGCPYSKSCQKKDCEKPTK